MKKRYMLTLSPKNMEGLQELLREIGVKPESGMVSYMVDEFLSGVLTHMTPEIRKAQEEGRNYTLTDFFVRVTSILQ